MKNYTLLLFLSILLWGCKKNYTCSHSIVYATAGIAFKGYDQADLDGAKVYEYKANTNYTQLLHAAPLDATAAQFVGDIAYAFSSYEYATRGFFYIEEGKDYKITIGSPSKEFLITDISATGPSSETWTQAEHCSPGSTQSKVVSYTLKLNGQAYTPIRDGGGNPNGYYIYLTR